MATPSVTILLPAHNESASVKSVVDGVRAVLAGVPGVSEILVVDDGSTDGTAGMAAAAGARVVSHDTRRGAGAAIKTGLVEARGDIVLLMDADASYPPAAIPGLLDALDGARQSIGARKEEAGTAPLARTVVKFLLRKMGEFLARHPIPDLNSGMRAFRRRDAMAFFHLLPDGHSCVSTLTLCFITVGFPVRFVAIDYFPRVGRSKFRVVSDTFRFFVQILRSVAYFAPLRVFLSASALFFLLGTVKSAADIARRGGLEESDIILFTFALGAGTIGLLADMIGKQSRKSILDDLLRPEDRAPRPGGFPPQDPP